MPQVTFYFDLGSPYAYLTAERLTTLLPEPIDWRPVLLGGLFKRTRRSSWARGHELSIVAHVLQAAASVGLDRQDTDAATRDPAIKLALREATDAAYELGVIGVPTIAVDDELFWGDDRLEDAAAHLRTLAA